MKLSKIEITNFRCFESLALELRPDINVIVGVNGAGKTTILDAIAIALYDAVAAFGGAKVGSRSSHSISLRASDIQIVPAAGSAVVARKDFVQVRAVAGDYFPVPGLPCTTTDGKLIDMDWTNLVRFVPPDRFTYGHPATGSAIQPAKYGEALWMEIRKTDERAHIPLPAIAYYRAGRRIASMPALGAVLDQALPREGAYVNALSAGANYQAMCQWLYLREDDEFRHNGATSKEDRRIFADLTAARTALSRTIQNVQRIYFEGRPPRLKIDVQASAGSHAILELEQLSDGYRNLLALVLDFSRRLAQANPNWPNPLEAPGILLIDEVELHLHPKWQQTVIPNLRAAFPNTQIIVATHSPEVLTTVHRENIYLLGSDHVRESIPADVGTFGAESSRVLQEVFAVNARPLESDVPIVSKLRDYLLLVESQQQGTDQGRAMRAELEQALGRSDPDLLTADARISQLRVLKGK